MLKLYVRCCSDMLLHFRVKRKGQNNILGPDWPSWPPLRHLEATALLLGALGDLVASWGIGRSCSSYVGLCYDMLKLYVRFCSAMLLTLHPKMLPPSRTKIFEGFLRAMLVFIWGQVTLPCGYVGAILGPTSLSLGLCWRLYGIEGKSPTSTPCTDRAVWADFFANSSSQMPSGDYAGIIFHVFALYIQRNVFICMYIFVILNYTYKKFEYIQLYQRWPQTVCL